MRSILGFALVTTFVMGCSSEEVAVAPAAPKSPDAPKVDAPETKTGTTSSALEQTFCRYLIPKSAEGTKVVCYDLTVKESRRPGASDKTIKIHLARIKGTGAGVPTIELIGGPGGGGDDLVGGIVAGVKDLTDAYGPLLAKGDLVVFDQRGVGRSLPRLGCPPRERAERSVVPEALKSRGHGQPVASALHITT